MSTRFYKNLNFQCNNQMDEEILKKIGWIPTFNCLVFWSLLAKNYEG